MQSQITVNGAVHPCADIACVRDLVAALALDTRKIAIEQNGAIVPRSQYDATPVAPGDIIEIVGFIGGG